MPVVATPKVAAPAPPPPKVIVSDDPKERLAQVDGFFRRNPGYHRTGTVGERTRDFLAGVPVIGPLTKMFEPTELGYGQLIHDQVQWQIDTRRQPDNAWWMRMNKQLVGDPLRAEAALRAGRPDALATDSERAWATYVERSDAIRKELGLPADSSPAALTDAYRGASLITRAKVALLMRPQARQALWDAHKASLEEGLKHVGPMFDEVNAKAPQEAEFGMGWANIVGGWALLNPPATGHQALLAQKYVLPGANPYDTSKPNFLQRTFARILDAGDRSYERTVRERAKPAADAAPAS